MNPRTLLFVGLGLLAGIGGYAATRLKPASSNPPASVPAAPPPAPAAPMPAPAPTAPSSPKAAEAAPAKADTEPSVAPAKPKGQNPMARMMKQTIEMMKDPMMRTQMQRAMAPQIEMLYGDLLAEWQLQGAEREACTTLLTDRLMSMVEAQGLVWDETLSEDDVIRQQTTIFDAAQAALTKGLSPDRVTRLQTYDAEMPDRMRAREVDDRLKVLDLDDTQRRLAREALLQDDPAAPMRGMPGGSTPGYAPMRPEEIRAARAGMGAGDPGQIQKTLTEMKAAQARRLERLQTILPPEQMARYRQSEEAQARMMEMGMQMMQGGAP